MKNIFYKLFQDELINAIKTLLSEKYPDYIFEAIYEDPGIHFLGEKYIRIKFWDLVNQRRLWVGLSVSEKEQLKPDISLIEELIYRIDSELKKFKEGES